MAAWTLRYLSFTPRGHELQQFVSHVAEKAREDGEVDED